MLDHFYGQLWHDSRPPGSGLAADPGRRRRGSNLSTLSKPEQPTTKVDLLDATLTWLTRFKVTHNGRDYNVRTS